VPYIACKKSYHAQTNGKCLLDGGLNPMGFTTKIGTYSFFVYLNLDFGLFVNVLTVEDPFIQQTISKINNL
jgi:hypothetical protein